MSGLELMSPPTGNFSTRHSPFAGRRRVSVGCGCTAALDQGTVQFGAMEIGAVEIGRVLSERGVVVVGNLVSPSMWCAGNRAGRRPVRETLVRQVFPRRPRTGCTTGSALSRAAPQAPWPNNPAGDVRDRRAVVSLLGWLARRHDRRTDRGAFRYGRRVRRRHHPGRVAAAHPYLVRRRVDRRGCGPRPGVAAAARPSLCRSGARSELSITASAETGFTAGGIGDG